MWWACQSQRALVSLGQGEGSFLSPVELGFERGVFELAFEVKAMDTVAL